MKKRESFRAHHTQFPYDGTYVNLRTGELRTFRHDVPQGSEWQLVSSRYNLSLEQARHIIRGSLIGVLKPEQLHYASPDAKSDVQSGTVSDTQSA